MKFTNKKGFYFTIIVLFCIILLLLVSFQVKREYASEGIKTRILTINNFIKSMERDASRAIYISGYRTLVASLDYITSKNHYLNEDSNGDPVTINEVFADALFNGSLNYSLQHPEAENLLANTSLKDWQERTIDLADATNLDLNFSEINPNNLLVAQTDPWNIIISIPIEYNLSDPVSGVTWYRNTRLNTTISILDSFEDPLYVLEFGSSCGNKIFNGNYLRPLMDSQCGTANITAFLNTPGAGSMYVNSTHAPSYINRLIGNLGCFRHGTCTDPNGIESLYKNTGPSCAITNATSSIVDFKYNHVDADSYVQGAPSWVHLCKTDDFPTYGIHEDCAS